MPNDYHIKNTDALSYLSKLEPRGLDALFTDPPYSSGGGQRELGRATGEKYCSKQRNPLPDFVGDTMDQRANFRFTESWLRLAAAALKPGAYAGLFCDWRQIGVFTDAFQAAGFSWRGIAVWDKTEGVRPQKGAYRNQCEYVIWGTLGARGSTKILPGVFRHSNVTRNKLHQTQKPVEVMDWLLSITDPGAVVLDPFMGSASTGVAALRSGRRFVGCEVVPDIYQIAEGRLKTTQLDCAS